MATPDPIGDGPDMTAAELALGVLDGEERSVALRRVLAEPAFAAEVEMWRGRLAALFASWPEVAPSAEVEARILAADRATAAVTVLQVRRGWRSAAAVGAIAAALVLGIAIGPQLQPPPPVPATPVVVPSAPLLAAITSTAKGAPVAAAYDADAGEIRLAGGIDTPDGRSAELWAIRGTAAPVPLGLMTAGSTRITVRTDRRALMAGGTTLAVSIEPVGGSPTGLPTGPVVATGVLAAG